MGDERVGVGKGGRVWLGWNGVGDERERDWKQERKRREGKVLAPPWQAQLGTELAVTPHPRVLFNRKP